MSQSHHVTFARLSRAALLTCALCGVLPSLASAQRPLKVYISVDMEGIAGVVTGDQLGPTGFEYGRAREFMTAEALAAIAGARDAGATEIVVSDSHGNGESLLIDQFPDDVRIVRSWPRPLMMMEGIDSTFAAAIFIGYHASTTSPAGVRAHTISSANYASVSLNGVAMPEAGINAAIAGRFGVPVVFISGDDVAVDETRRLLGDVEGAVVKRAISFHAASTMTPKAAQALIRAHVKTALDRRSAFKPYVVRAPVTLDLVFKNYRPAEILSYLSIVQRTTSHGIRLIGKDIIEVSRFLEFVGTYEPGIAP
jgi:D-amino peptidase